MPVRDKMISLKKLKKLTITKVKAGRKDRQICRLKARKEKEERGEKEKR